MKELTGQKQRGTDYVKLVSKAQYFSIATTLKSLQCSAMGGIHYGNQDHPPGDPLRNLKPRYCQKPGGGRDGTKGHQAKLNLIFST